jgi:hypothetical protein
MTRTSEALLRLVLVTRWLNAVRKSRLIQFLVRLINVTSMTRIGQVIPATVLAVSIGLSVSAHACTSVGQITPNNNTGLIKLCPGSFNALLDFQNYGVIEVSLGELGDLTNSGTGKTLSNLSGGTVDNYQGSIVNDASALLRNAGSGSNISNRSAGFISNIGPGTVLQNQKGAVLTNDPLAHLPNDDPHLVLSGSVLIENIEGALLLNEDPGTILYNKTTSAFWGSEITNDGRIVNRNSATIINAGQFASITNSGPSGPQLANSGSGSNFYNQNGAKISNSGSIENLVGATFTNESGAEVINTGIFLNQGFPGSTIINTDDGTVFNNGGTLINRASIIDNQNSAMLNNGNGAVLENTSAGKVNNSATMINNGQIINSAGASSALTPTTFMVASGGMVTGVGTYTQTDNSVGHNLAKTKIDGVMDQTSVMILGGTIGGGGTINSGLAKGPFAACPIVGVCAVKGNINIGDPQTFTINSSLVMIDSEIEVQIEGTGTGQFDKLNVNGPLYFVGMNDLVFDFVDFLPNAGDMFTFLDAFDIDLSGLSAPFQISYTGLGPGFESRLLIDPYTHSFTLLAENAGTPVPEPAAIGLMIIGLVGMGLARSRSGLRTAGVHIWQIPSRASLLLVVAREFCIRLSATYISSMPSQSM